MGVEPERDALPVSHSGGDSEVLVEHEIRHVPVHVVSRWAIVLAGTTLVLWWAAIGCCWLVAAVFGLTADAEALAHHIGFQGFRLASAPVFLALGVLGVIWVVGVVIVALVAVTAYNLYASMLGGIRVQSVERSCSAGVASSSLEHPAAEAPVSVS
jgi:hypothetical protein